MRCLRRNSGLWCDAASLGGVSTPIARREVLADAVTDPRDATCSTCLRIAAEYGAAAAMRYAAVESGATQDPELVRERDDAIKRVNLVNKLLEAQGVFVCADCQELKRIGDRAQKIGTVAWCTECAPHKVT